MKKFISRITDFLCITKNRKLYMPGIAIYLCIYPVMIPSWASFATISAFLLYSILKEVFYEREIERYRERAELNHAKVEGVINNFKLRLESVESGLVMFRDSNTKTNGSFKPFVHTK